MVQVGELQEALDAIKWGVDYLLNCHTEPMKFVAMYGSSEVSSGTFKGGSPAPSGSLPLRGIRSL